MKRMEPVAIVGMSCRFPGANSPESFWRLLQNGISAIDKVPADRWPMDTYYSETLTPGKMNTERGGFISGADEFEPSFFGISPREALHMDPQQRLLLEVAWEAMERANIVPGSLAGSDTGVFIGCGNYDFGIRMARSYQSFDAYLGTGATVGMSANRLSYLLDLRGPSLTVETACSSSLVAIHLACQSLRNQETSVALVGASSLMQAPNQTIIYSQAQMMSPDGLCKTFDADANGYVRGEGCGMVVLKRLADAQQEGDPILAVIRGSAVNQDGLSNGLTAPNGPSQQAVIRQALNNAGVKPEQISYVETHGTGTPLGDPIEIKSLKAVLNKDRTSNQSCWLGSVKTNIGHLEAAAGMAGLFKTVLALQHKEIPPHLNLNELNPYISFEDTPFAIPTTRQPWESAETSRLAGISSFGFGGTNAHMVLEEWGIKGQGTGSALSGFVGDGSVDEKSLRPERSHHVLPLSAKSDIALEAMVARYSQYIEQHPGSNLADICFTASQKRSHFSHRLSLVADSTQTLQQQLQQIHQGELPLGATRHQLPRKKAPKLAFMFTGQGSQYIEMGQQLYQRQPIFRESLQRCDEILQPLLGCSLIELLYPNADNTDAATRLNQTAFTQPALFALEYSLAQLWQSWGIVPAVVMGHSVGEYVAACVAGVFSLEDGLKLIVERGRLMQALPKTGGMVAVLASQEEIQQAIAVSEIEQSSIAIAAINGPNSLTLSGKQADLDTLCQRLEQQGIKTKPLTVSHAFHSPLMEPMLAAFRQAAESVTFHTPKLKIVSNVTGQLESQAFTNPDYWCEHIVRAVNFAAGLKTLKQQKCKILLEVGPHPVLSGMVQRALSAQQEQDNTSAKSASAPICLPSLRAKQSDWSRLLETLGALYAYGVPVDWASFDAPYQRRALLLPTYPWQRQSYWVSPTDTVAQITEENSVLPALSGDLLQISDRLQKTDRFSTEELSLLPKLLESLKQLSEQPSHADSNNTYELIWEPQDQTNSATTNSSWLILANRGSANKASLGEALSKQLTQQGHRHRLLYKDEMPHTAAPTIRKAALQDAISTVLQNGISPVTGIVCLWGLEPTAATLDDCFELYQDVLSILQLLASQSPEIQSPKLWIVTHRASSLSTSQTGVFASPLWGLGKVVDLEHPQQWGGLIDLDDIAANETVVTQLSNELLSTTEENQIAFKGGTRHVARLVEKSLADGTSTNGIAVDSEGTYLITGGMGALGLSVAQWLVEQGAKHLVLTGRRAPSDKASDAITSLTAAGATVVTLSADVTIHSEMENVFEHIRRQLPPIKGVIHTAGSVSYEPIQSLSADSLSAVLKPKVIGSWILHQLTKDLALDFFVMFSSIASVWGSKGQAHYAAANQFLDSLSHYRQQQGLPALSINWGPWADGGMVTDEFETWLAAAGITPHSADQATTTLGKLLAQNQVHTTVVTIDWVRFKSLFELRGPSPLLEHLPNTKSLSKSANESSHSATVITEEKTASAKVLKDLQAVPPAQREERLTTFLQSEVARIMRLPAGQSVNLYDGFFEMGLDSLMAVELKTQLENKLACTLPGTVIFETPTVHALTQYLSTEVLGWQEKETEIEQSVTSNGENTTDELLLVTDMSETELDRSISDRLSKLESLIGGQ